MAERPETEPPARTSVEYVVFSNGGSRGNAGPGGAGSVLVRITTARRQSELIWYACMSYAGRRTTNNIAEYLGLVHGLRQAVAMRAMPLHVCEDSQLILQQVKQHRVPAAKHLRRFYYPARRDATRLGVVSWTHHLRVHNRMADAAANITMDAAASIQVTGDTQASSVRTETALIAQHLAADIGHWFDRRVPDDPTLTD